MNSNLTEPEFWDEYWSHLELPSIVNYSHSFERCLSKEITILTSGIKGEIFEIGCAPGKWIAHVATQSELLPCGIEYTQGGLNATIKNFEILKIKHGEIISGDFFKVQPFKEYDVVMSLGFIEHFDDATEVVARHLMWLKPGGLLI